MHCQLIREIGQAQAGFSLDAYAYYISLERRPKKPDMFVLTALYERAITEADKRRWGGEENAESALRTFWDGYLDLLVRSTSFDIYNVELGLTLTEDQ